MKTPKSKTKADGFIVLWDDNMGITCLMGWDEDCAGAICASDDSVAIFSDRKAARKAIDISTRYAQLCIAQGNIGNDDFIGSCRKCLLVVPCKAGGRKI